jgi:hypothetical protein
MKNKAFPAVLALAALFCAMPAMAQLDGFEDMPAMTGPAQSQYGGTIASLQKSRVTQPVTIAMIYHRFAGDMPDFRAWARASKKYQDAPDFDKLSILDQMTAQMRESYSLLTLQEPVTYDFPVVLSDYSFDNKGYFIRNLTQQTFFPVSYQGLDYALVPKDIIEKQWLPVEDMAAAKAIDDLRRKSPDGKTLSMTFTLVPVYASKDMTLTLDGKTYRLISADIRAIAFYDADGMPVWRRDRTDEVSAEDMETQKKLMELYR